MQHHVCITKQGDDAICFSVALSCNPDYLKYGRLSKPHPHYWLTIVDRVLHEARHETE